MSSLIVFIMTDGASFVASDETSDCLAEAMAEDSSVSLDLSSISANWGLNSTSSLTYSFVRLVEIRLRFSVGGHDTTSSGTSFRGLRRLDCLMVSEERLCRFTLEDQFLLVKLTYGTLYFNQVYRHFSTIVIQSLFVFLRVSGFPWILMQYGR